MCVGSGYVLLISQLMHFLPPPPFPPFLPPCLPALSHLPLQSPVKEPALGFTQTPTKPQRNKVRTILHHFCWVVSTLFLGGHNLSQVCASETFPCAHVPLPLVCDDVNASFGAPATGVGGQVSFLQSSWRCGTQIVLHSIPFVRQVASGCGLSENNRETIAQTFFVK